jgi:hypothetical protein
MYPNLLHLQKVVAARCLSILSFSTLPRSLELQSFRQLRRELQTAKEATKDDEALDRLLQAQDRAEKKSQKEGEAQQRREDRAMNVRARKAKEALKKAQR